MQKVGLLDCWIAGFLDMKSFDFGIPFKEGILKKRIIFEKILFYEKHSIPYNNFV